MRLLADRLRDYSRGSVEWRVADPKTGSYCIAFGHTHYTHPEHEAREWLRKHRKEFPGGRFVGHEVQRVEVLSQTDELICEALTEIQRLREALGKANEQAERFERGWYLRGDALESIDAIAMRAIGGSATDMEEELTGIGIKARAGLAQ